MKWDSQPVPGTDEARAKGCPCSEMNVSREGYRDFLIHRDCPIHAEMVQTVE
jgi:hypothetical protein